MSSTKEIKEHMNGVRETQKITSAMYLIASTKLRRAKNELTQTRPYFHALQSEMEGIFLASADVESRFFADSKDTGEDERCGCLIITADKGLAGAYNQNVIRTAEKLMQQHPRMKLYVIGEYGRQYFRKRQVFMEENFTYTAQNPTLHRVREISLRLLEDYEAGEVNKIFIIYTDWKNGISEEVQTVKLLPLQKSDFVKNEEGNAGQKYPDSTFTFWPSAEAVLDAIVPNYITGFVYSALVDSYCSEQNARMTAMSAANDNAEKILENLSKEYNRVRQEAITLEITEISSGARSLKKSREALGFE